MESDKSLLEIVEAMRQEIEAAVIDSEQQAEAFRVRYLGQKNGLVTNLFKGIREVPKEARREAGQQLNALRTLAETRLSDARNQLRQDQSTDHGGIDLTLPGRRSAPAGSVWAGMTWWKALSVSSSGEETASGCRSRLLGVIRISGFFTSRLTCRRSAWK